MVHIVPWSAILWVPRAGHALTVRRLPREGCASYDRHASQEDRGDVEISEDGGRVEGGGAAHDYVLFTSVLRIHRAMDS